MQFTNSQTPTPESGFFRWVGNDDRWSFQDEVLMESTEKLLFRDSELSISSETDGHIDYNADITHDFQIGGVEQINLSNGALSPTTDSDIDLGTTSLLYKELFVDDITLTTNITRAEDTNTVIQGSADQWNFVTGGSTRCTMTNSGVKVTGDLDVTQIINTAGTEITVLNEDFTVERNDAAIATLNLETDLNNGIAWKLQNNGNSFNFSAQAADTNFQVLGPTATVIMKVDTDITANVMNLTASQFRINQGKINYDLVVSGDNETNLLYTDASADEVGIATNAPVCTFDINGGFAANLVAKTGAYTATTSDHTIICGAGNESFTVTLPAASTVSGIIYNIKNIGTGTITVDGNASENIDGATTAVISSQFDSITIQCTGSEWFIL